MGQLDELDELRVLRQDLAVFHYGKSSFAFSYLFNRCYKLLGWDDQTAAALMGTSQPTIRRWLNDENPPAANLVSYFMITEIDQVYDATVDELAEAKRDPSTDPRPGDSFVNSMGIKIEVINIKSMNHDPNYIGHNNEDIVHATVGSKLSPSWCKLSEWPDVVSNCVVTKRQYRGY